MAKSRKVSKSFPGGILPDYRHAVETVAESDGFGSSDRVPLEFVNTQDTYGHRMPGYSFNVDGHDGFPVPAQFFSISKMSVLDKKELEVRLKGELERVRKLQNKIASLNLDAMIHHEETRPLDAEDFPMNDISMSTVKTKCPPGRNGARTKGGAVPGRRNESLNHGLPQSRNFNMLLKQCGTLLTRLMKQDQLGVFQRPVDIVELKIPDYFSIIKHPMDLGTVKTKLHSDQYSNPLEFAADVRLTFNNAVTYNPPGHAVNILAETMRNFFEVRWKAIEKKIPSIPVAPTVMESGDVYAPPPKKQKISHPEIRGKGDGLKEGKGDGLKEGMSDDEKKRLGSEVDALLDELPNNIISFLKESSMSCNQENEDEIEIDFDSLSDGTLLTLRMMLDNYLLEKQKGHLPVEPSRIAIKNELGNQTNKVDGPAEDEVDVIGDDPEPPPCLPKLHDDKDDARKSAGCSILTSSNSESGSMSSESQGSSALKQGDIQSSIPAPEETIDAMVQRPEGSKVDESRDLLNGHTEKYSVSNTSVEHNRPTEDILGGNDPPERQASLEKEYRAALLRERFADIIIKAQGNKIEKEPRPDPEKLKLEREELERRRREEKVRLQAEARAAEEARVKARLEAEAEARRKRELEREAARQALHEMEKTVEINEGRQFIEDFEMLSSAPDEHLQSLMAELDPQENDLLSSFKFQGNTNPLEQLGLYMKNDDEDEEEIKPPSILNDDANDPEEGEID